jgi:hypothetical protein
MTDVPADQDRDPVAPGGAPVGDGVPATGADGVDTRTDPASEPDAALPDVAEAADVASRVAGAEALALDQRAAAFASLHDELRDRLDHDGGAGA